MSQTTKFANLPKNGMGKDGEILLTLISQDFKLIRKGNYFTTEEHDSFVINPQKAFFYWNSRGIFGNAVSYLMQVREMSYHDALETISRTVGDFKYVVREIQPQTPNIALVEVFHNYGKDHRGYWYDKRGYTDETIDRFMLGYTGEYWTIPIFNNGVFKNFQIRGYDKFGNKVVKSFYSGIGRLAFNFDLLPQDRKTPIYITESIVDAIVLLQNGLFAVSHNSGASGWDHEWSQQLMDYENIYIAFDNDAAGIQGSVRTSLYLKHNADILIWPDTYPDKYDLTDLYKDGKTMDDLYDCFLPSYLFKS